VTSCRPARRPSCGAFGLVLAGLVAFAGLAGRAHASDFGVFNQADDATVVLAGSLREAIGALNGIIVALSGI